MLATNHCRRQNEKEDVMKFLLVVAIIHYLIRAIHHKENSSDQKEVELKNDNILHPAEFGLR